MPSSLSCPARNKCNIRGAETCVRCDCDLAILWTISDAAAWPLEQARGALRLLDVALALSNADRSWMLIHTPSSAPVGALAATLSGQNEVVSLWRSRLSFEPQWIQAIYSFVGKVRTEVYPAIMMNCWTIDRGGGGVTPAQFQPHRSLAAFFAGQRCLRRAFATNAEERRKESPFDIEVLAAIRLWLCGDIGVAVRYTFFVLSLAGRCIAGDSEPMIDEHRLRRHIEVLSSDAFEGRAPGSPGEEKSVAYLIDQFQRAGLEPGGIGGTWTQDVPIVGIKSAVTGRLATPENPGELTFPQDYVAWSPRLASTTTVDDTEVVFVGYGVTAPEYGWDDYRGVDVRGKTVVILVNDPPIPDPRHPDRLDERMFKGNAMTYYGRWTYKFEEAGRRGAAAALIIHETKPAAYPWFVVINSWGRERFDLEGDNSPKVNLAGWISLERAQKLFTNNGTTYDAAKAAALRKDFRAQNLKEKASFIAHNTTRPVKSKNVLALLPGSSPRLRNEWLIYTAHWDHLGRDPKLEGDQIFNGALDNASGTGGLLELARVFAAAKQRPPRSVLFLSVTAEEQGLLGSAYYAAHPVHPLTQTLANINMDVLNQWGRTRDVRIVGAGNSTLEDVLTREARRQGRITHPEAHPERGGFYRSDHFEFMKLGLPALYAKSGEEYRNRPADFGEKKVNEYIERDYHKVSDEIKPDWDLSGAVEDLELLRAVGVEVATARRWPKWRTGAEFKAARDRAMQEARSIGRSRGGSR